MAADPVRYGLTAISHYFVMDWAAVWMDIVGGLAIAGAIAAWVPQDFWKTLFLTDHPVLATLWGPLVGPLVAIIAFVCSVGNIPLAAVLWNGGISFGGVLAFILADLIVLPILNIYRKYYGLKMAAFLITFYVAMAAAALVVEGIFGVLGLVPHERQDRVVEAMITWNYTTWLNLGLLYPRFLSGMAVCQDGGHAYATDDEQATLRRRGASPRPLELTGGSTRQARISCLRSCQPNQMMSCARSIPGPCQMAPRHGIESTVPTCPAPHRTLGYRGLTCPGTASRVPLLDAPRMGGRATRSPLLEHHEVRC
jgi:Predicted permease